MNLFQSVSDRITAAREKRLAIENDLRRVREESPEVRLAAQLAAAQAEESRAVSEQASVAGQERAERRKGALETYRWRALALVEALAAASLLNDALQNSYDQIRGEFAAHETPEELSCLAPWSALSASGGGKIIGMLQRVRMLMPGQLTDTMQERLAAFDQAERAREAEDRRRTAIINRMRPRVSNEEFGSVTVDVGYSSSYAAGDMPKVGGSR